MKIKIKHETHYKLENPARRSAQYLRLTPRSDRKQKVLSWDIQGPQSLTPWYDGFGNMVHFASEMEEHDSLSILVEGEVMTKDTNGVLPLDDGLPPIMFLRETELTKTNRDVSRFSNKYAKVREKEGDVAMLHALMNELHERIEYDCEITDLAEPGLKALKAKKGTAIDFAHLFITACRHHEIPARYISGYYVNQDGKATPHGWSECYIPNLGWVSFDPSQCQSATDSYVDLAVGYDFASTAPIIGARSGGEGEEMSVNVEVSTQTQS